MTSRERVKRAKNYLEPDMVPVEYFYTGTPVYEHGEKVNDLLAKYPGDFGPYVAMHPEIPATDFDPDGRYHAFRKDEWGTTWEYHIFGVAGIAKDFPLRDLDALDGYVFPKVITKDSPEFPYYKKAVADWQKNYYYSEGIGGFFERMIALRPFEDVLCDLITNEEKLVTLLDRLTDHFAAHIDAAIAAGADGIAFGDDFGTELSLIFSHDIFREYFFPRYKKLIEPARAAGLDVHFHSCGKVDSLFEDFREMGVNSIWPQLPRYDMEELAYTIKHLGLALSIHTDRANTMTFGTPDDVRQLVNREFDVFRPDKGGSWFYIESDNGFPYENIKALVETVGSFRTRNAK